MDKKQNLLLLALGTVALAILFLAYSNHWHNPFHFDDAHTIETNAYIRDVLRAEVAGVIREEAQKLAEDMSKRTKELAKLEKKTWRIK